MNANNILKAFHKNTHVKFDKVIDVEYFLYRLINAEKQTVFMNFVGNKCIQMILIFVNRFHISILSHKHIKSWEKIQTALGMYTKQRFKQAI